MIIFILINWDNFRLYKYTWKANYLYSGMRINLWMVMKVERKKNHITKNMFINLEKIYFLNGSLLKKIYLILTMVNAFQLITWNAIKILSLRYCWSYKENIYCDKYLKSFQIWGLNYSLLTLMRIKMLVLDH